MEGPSQFSQEIRPIARPSPNQSITNVVYVASNFRISCVWLHTIYAEVTQKIGKKQYFARDLMSVWDKHMVNKSAHIKFTVTFTILWIYVYCMETTASLI